MLSPCIGLAIIVLGGGAFTKSKSHGMAQGWDSISWPMWQSWLGARLTYVTFLGEFVLPLKVPECLHVPFN